MTASPNETRTLVVEREFAHPPERLWRALTQSDLLAEWIMPNDFRPEVGERFEMVAEWGKVEGEVLAIEPLRSLSYRWNGPGLESVVHWTLDATPAGTRLRMEQTSVDGSRVARANAMCWRLGRVQTSVRPVDAAMK
ncbi:SRPBCC domain-containing protein [Pelagerythrobacter aerophilus]|uniref:Polyketide cyclase n=1 Tax=Pelagerythrobacter aerophilus TaxID=2306995 RepID=A0A418NEA6_9SPHN|nr:SRPBCC domain-containing protein [Pelagerythrobacter aerophilus]RIV76665.1 polyketide cyclase [Pelagerythrobacter aerophilus]